MTESDTSEWLRTDSPRWPGIVAHRPGRGRDVNEIEGKARKAVKRATDATGDEPDDVHVMGLVAVTYVIGSVRLVRSLVEQPGIDSAIANERPEPWRSPGQNLTALAVPRTAIAL